VSEDDAITLAQAYVKATLDGDLKLIGARKSSRFPSEWNVLFETTLPNGVMMDGPTIVIVDEGTRQTRFFPSI
jgi:hypothetical protein